MEDYEISSATLAIVPLGDEISKVYDSMEFTKYDGFVPRYVSECCRGLKEIYKGYHWMLYDDYL